MKYTRQDYLSDCRNPEMVHIKDPERFRAFYEELGRDPVQKAQRVVHNRIKFVKPEGHIIELGCHIGFNCIHWGRMGFNCIGVDISQTLIDEANKNLSKERHDVQEIVRFIRADILDLLPEELPYFHTIVLTETLEHVIDPLPILNMAKSLLSQSGKIYVSAPSVRVGTYSHVRGVSVDDVKKWAKMLELQCMFIPDDWGTDFKSTQAILWK